MPCPAALSLSSCLALPPSRREISLSIAPIQKPTVLPLMGCRDEPSEESKSHFDFTCQRRRRKERARDSDQLDTCDSSWLAAGWAPFCWKVLSKSKEGRGRSRRRRSSFKQRSNSLNPPLENEEDDDDDERRGGSKARVPFETAASLAHWSHRGIEGTRPIHLRSKGQVVSFGSLCQGET